MSPDRARFPVDGDHRPLRHDVRTMQALSLLQKLSDGGYPTSKLDGWAGHLGNVSLMLANRFELRAG